jgi:glycosyltransferase involved in cell wall biosynthesis
MKYHILISTSGYPTRSGGGNQYLFDMFHSLAMRGHKVSVLQYTHLGFFSWVRRLFIAKRNSVYLEIDGVRLVEVYLINIFPNRKHFIPFINLMARFQIKFVLDKYIKNVGMPDIFQHHFIILGYSRYSNYICRKLNLPYIIFEHAPRVGDDYVIPKLSGFMALNELHQFVSGAGDRIARSSKFREKYGIYYESTFTVVPNFIPDSFFSAPPRVDKSEIFTFVAIGRLQEVKRYDRLIEAFKLGFEHRNARLVIVGDGILRSELQYQVIKSGLQGRVVFLGRLDRRRIMDTLDASHSLVVSSDEETFGNTVLEAMARGLPVISTQCGGPEDIILPDVGFLSKLSAEDLSFRMVELWDTYNCFDPEMIRNKCRERYGENRILSEIEEKYSNIIGRKPMCNNL